MSSLAAPKLIAEAEECIKKAEKLTFLNVSQGDHLETAEKAEKFEKFSDFNIKTSLTKWSADYDGAASEYQRAALNYRNARQLEKAKEIYVKAAECYLKINTPFHAAKQYEQAGFCLRDAGKLQEGADLVCKASACFQQAGDLDTATLVLAKAAKIMEDTNADQAIQMYKRAGDLAEIEDKYNNAADYMGKAASMEIRRRQLINARSSYEKQLEYSIKAGGTGGAASTPARVVLSMVVVNVAAGDLVAARNAMDSAMSVPNFGSSEECHIGACLVDALEKNDSKMSVNVLRNPIFKFMDNEVAKLAAEMLNSRKEQAEAEDAATTTAAASSSHAPNTEAVATDDAPPAEESQDLSFLQ